MEKPFKRKYIGLQHAVYKTGWKDAARAVSDYLKEEAKKNDNPVYSNVEVKLSQLLEVTE